MPFDWKAFGIKIAMQVPLIVAGIQALHGEAKSGVEKKQMALDALQLSTVVADNTLPDDQKKIADAVSDATGSIIDKVVSIFKATGVSNFTPSKNEVK